ncbi:helix-turn-helix transcriptional regulator [Hydrogenophaga borbori]
MTQPTQPKNHKRLSRASASETTRNSAALPSFDELPDWALVRQSQLVRDTKNLTRPTPLPFSPATFWRRVKDGTFPKPIKLGKRITCWRVGEVRAWIASQSPT